MILYGKNILQGLLCSELTTMRHVSFIKNLDNFDAYLYSDQQSSSFLTLEIQSKLNLHRNGSYAAKSIECTNHKLGHTSSFIKQVLKQDNPVLTLSCFSLVFWKESEPYTDIEHFIEERCSFYSLSMDTPYFQTRSLSR